MKTSTLGTALLFAVALASCSKVSLEEKTPTDLLQTSAVTISSFSGRTSAGGNNNLSASDYLGSLKDFLFVFTDGSTDANWQGASKGFSGNVAINGLQASERTSGNFAFGGKLYSNAASAEGWQNIINNNGAQASFIGNQQGLLNQLHNDLEGAFSEINILEVTGGYDGISPEILNGFNSENNTPETFVFNINDEFTVKTKINIRGDFDDLFIFRWDTDRNFSNGYNGQVKFQSGGAIVPQGYLNAWNFIHVAGDINASGGGNTPAAPYPQGPRTQGGYGPLINGGSDFNGGGFFTGYWLTTGKPEIFTAGEQPYGKTSSLSNAVFAGGWYSKTTKFSMTSGTSGVYVKWNPYIYAN